MSYHLLEHAFVESLQSKTTARPIATKWRRRLSLASCTFRMRPRQLTIREADNNSAAIQIPRELQSAQMLMPQTPGQGPARAS